MSESTSSEFCQTCGSETNYKCLACNNPVCNKSVNCSISAPEETPGWKAGFSVAFCCSCKATSERPIDKSRLNNQGSNFKTKRKCLDLSEKVAVIDYAKGHRKLGARKIADWKNADSDHTKKQGIDTCFVRNKRREG